MQKTKKLAPLAAVVVLVFSFGFTVGKNNGTSTRTITSNGTTTIFSNDDYGEIKNMNEVWQELQDKYVDASKLNQNKLEQSALEGFVEGIGDPYTVYMQPEDSTKFNNELEGELEGVGAQLDSIKGNLTIVNTLKRSPAEKAGLLPKDIILKIDDTVTQNLSIAEAVKLIRGKKGTSVKLIIGRQNSPEPIEVTIVRDTVVIASVELTPLKNELVHLSINHFNNHTKQEFDDAVQEILLQKPRGIVMDLRGNGGGYLETSVELLSEFIRGKKQAVIIKKRNGVDEDSYPTTSGTGRLLDTPMVVLVDGGTASASEILAGALQDYKRAALIGEQTYGKGSVQELIKLKDGSLLRATIAKWFTPLDRAIDQVGIKPDVEVKFNAEEFKTGKDRQLETAIRYLTGN